MSDPVLSEMFGPGLDLALTEPFSVPRPAPPTGPDPADPARFAGEPVLWVELPPSIPIRAFARGARRVYQPLQDGLPGGATAATGVVLVEIAPLPGFLGGVLHHLPGGVPVQYIMLSGGDTPPDSTAQTTVAAGETVVSTHATAWVGLVAQDRVCRDPRAWSHALTAAATAAGAATSAGWAAWVAELAAVSPPRIRVLDHVGRPATSGTFTVNNGSGTTTAVTLGPARPGDTGIDVAGASAAVTGAGSDALLASADAARATLGAPLAVTADDRHVLATAAGAWFAPRTAGVTGLQRWVAGSRAEPLVDGNPYFARLVDDLRAAKGAGGAAQLAGWAFNMHALQDPTRTWGLVPGHDDTEIVKLVDELVSSGASMRLLVNQFLQISDADLEALHAEAVEFLLALLFALGLAQVASVLRADAAGWVALTAAYTMLLIPGTDDLLRRVLTSVAEISKDTVDAIEAQHPGVAVWSPYPAAFSDNPLAEDPLTLHGITLPLHHLGVYHMKIAMTQPPGGAPVAYVGGIDINSDRVDDPLHRAIAPFHDVQMRLTGPAANEVAKVYAERAAHDDTTAPIAPVADSSTLPHAGEHLIQIGRTYFEPSGAVPFPSAPQGEHTTHETLLAAIAAAKDYIYIEEQYFTPDDTYVRALTDAGSAPGGARALVITVPDRADQPFGAQRRGEIFAHLQTTWGDRLHVGAPLRRHLDPAPSGAAGLGRFLLRRAVTVNDGEMTFGPAARVPKPPFWAFVEGELVYVGAIAGGTTATEDGTDVNQSFTVTRDDATNPRWGAKLVRHEEGAPVLAVQIPGIYVHAKVMMIDDVFVSVGSANLNRRGLFHDGELNTFTIPTQLKRDPANPALQLRCRLWAEHLGLPPELGLSLLSDPHGALPYFGRSWLRGSRWQPLSFGGVATVPVVALSGGDSMGSEVAHLIIGTFEATERDDIWATLVDPTSRSDPVAVRGPELGPL